jgi:phospholipid/cholesterol/gamma-HCH transport system substrate-binding protein
MSKAMRLGLFIVATLLIFGLGVFWIGSGQFRFSSTYRLNAYFQNVAGLPDGANVRVGGVHLGTVHQVILPTRSDQKVRVEMDMKENTRRVIKKDSMAAIQTEGLVGDQYVEITFGSPDAPPVKDGDTIAAATPLQISDMMKKANGILDSVQNSLQGFGQTVNNLQGVTAKLNNGQGSAGALINDRSVYQHVNEAARNLQEDTEAMKHNFLLRGFFKNRGYEDSSEIKKNEISALPPGNPIRTFTYRASKLFDKPDSAKVKEGKMLDEAGRYLEQNGFGLAVVACFADLKGDTDKQKQLTEARAAVAREYLVQHFKLDDTKLRTVGGGKNADAPDGGSVEVSVYLAGKSGK